MKEQILILLPRKLFPLVSGYSLKNYHLIKLLSTKYKISIIVISGKLSREEKAFYEEFTSDFRAYHISKSEKIFGIFRAFLKGQPLQSGLFFSYKIAKAAKRISKNDAHIIIYELIRMMPYFDFCKGNHINIFDMSDSLGLHYQESYKKTYSLFWKAIYFLDYKKLLNYEKQSISKCDVTFLFNQREADYWSSDGNVTCIPHGVKEELFSYSCKESNCGRYIAFIGKMDYRPNIDAVIWYTRNIHMRMKNPPDLLIIGAYPTKQVKNLTRLSSGIKVMGYLDDPYELLSSAIAVIAPMQTGGGIQNKALESMALGKVVLLSAKTAVPFTGAQHGKEFLICDTLKDYEDALSNLEEDRKLAEEIGKNAREFVRKYYTWKNYGDTYDMSLLQLVEEKLLNKEGEKEL